MQRVGQSPGLIMLALIGVAGSAVGKVDVLRIKVGGRQFLAV
jgi:hypothetical protein